MTTPKTTTPNATAVETLRRIRLEILEAEKNKVQPEYDMSTTARQLADRILDIAKTERDEKGELLVDQWLEKNNALWAQAKAMGLYQQVWDLIVADTSGAKKKK